MQVSFLLPLDGYMKIMPMYKNIIIRKEGLFK